MVMLGEFLPFTITFFFAARKIFDALQQMLIVFFIGIRRCDPYLQ